VLDLFEQTVSAWLPLLPLVAKSPVPWISVVDPDAKASKTCCWIRNGTSSLSKKKFATPSDFYQLIFNFPFLLTFFSLKSTGKL
jgi:hypothetical protein